MYKIVNASSSISQMASMSKPEIIGKEAFGATQVEGRHLGITNYIYLSHF
jgi:hypothetical protein